MNLHDEWSSTVLGNSMYCGRTTDVLLDYHVPGSPEIRWVGVTHTPCPKDLGILRYDDDVMVVPGKRILWCCRKFKQRFKEGKTNSFSLVIARTVLLSCIL